MKRFFLIPTIVFALLMVGCSENDSRVDSEKHQPEGDEVLHLKSEGHKAGLIPLANEVNLDNGEKWMANVETSEGIDKMLALVKKEESKGTPDYVLLKESLDKEFNILLEKCTMTGESHDQLHNYLLPLKAKFVKLDSSSTKETTEDLKSYLMNYYNYFK
jgi:hypothetical protein